MNALSVLILRALRLLPLCVVLACVCRPVQAAPSLTRAEFEAQAAPLIGLPGKAHVLIRLSDAALADGAADEPAYAALAHGYKSHALWLRNDFIRAEAEAHQAVSADPQSALGYFFLADALNAQLRYDDAYLACLHGADRRDDAEKRGAARARCRTDYARRVTLDPATLIKTARSGRLTGRTTPTLVSGRIADIRSRPEGDELVFTCPAGTLTCRLAPPRQGLKLTPVTGAEDGKRSGAAAGLRKDQFVTVRGMVHSSTDDVRMEQCEIFTQ